MVYLIHDPKDNLSVLIVEPVLFLYISCSFLLLVVLYMSFNFQFYSTLMFFCFDILCVFEISV